MNFDKLNQWIMTAANVGVLAGIVFLGVEIQQNTTMVRAQTRDAMTEKQIAYYELNINNIEAANIFRNIENASEVDRTSNEYRQFTLITLAQLRMWENELYQYRQGLFDLQELESRRRFWATTLRSTSLSGQARREVWENQKEFFAPDFIEVLETLMRGDQI